MKQNSRKVFKIKIMPSKFLTLLGVVIVATIIATQLTWPSSHFNGSAPSLKVMQRLSWPPNVTGLAWSPDGSKLASFSSYTTVVTIWDASSWQIIREFRRNSGGYGGNAFIWLPNGLISAPATPQSPDEARFSLSLWDPETGTLVKSVVGPTDEKSLKNNHASTMAVSNDGNTVAIANYAALHEVFLLNTQTWSVDKTLTLPPSRGIRHGPAALSFGPHNLLAVGATGGNLYIFDIEQQKLVRTIDAYLTDRTIDAVAFSPDGTLIATAPTFLSVERPPLDGAPVRIWKLDTAQRIATLGDAGDHGTFPQVVWNRDGNLLAAISFSGEFKVWHFGDEQQLVYTTRFQDPGYAVAFSKDGALAVAEGANILILR
jgi:WD40 repeat protein